MKYTPATIKKITDLISKDDYTTEEICERVGISEAIFYKWKIEKLEFLEAIKKAEEVRLAKFKKAARSGLLTLLEGKEFEEVVTEYEGVRQADGTMKPMVKSKRVTKKMIMPNPTSVIFALKNLDKETFKDIVHQEVEQNTTLNATIDNTTTIVRKVVFKTRETTSKPQVLPNAINN